QVSLFVTELFPNVPGVSGSLTGLLFISSDVPVGVLGLAFDTVSFVPLPLATQLTESGVARTGTFNGNITVVTPFPISNPSAPVFATMAPLPSNIIGIPSPPITQITPPVAPTGPLFSGFPALPTIGGGAVGGTTVFINSTTVINVDTLLLP